MSQNDIIISNFVKACENSNVLEDLDLAKLEAKDLVLKETHPLDVTLMFAIINSLYQVNRKCLLERLAAKAAPAPAPAPAPVEQSQDSFQLLLFNPANFPFENRAPMPKTNPCGTKNQTNCSSASETKENFWDKVRTASASMQSVLEGYPNKPSCEQAASKAVESKDNMKDFTERLSALYNKYDEMVRAIPNQVSDSFYVLVLGGIDSTISKDVERAVHEAIHD